mmetsp:Transcript_16797/g.51582  ORF Transcript_16797/g.51582 Transcript_16797/m.51582 type:complete len:208 (-) Transcript_16797:355-978(-)
MVGRMASVMLWPPSGNILTLAPISLYHRAMVGCTTGSSSHQSTSVLWISLAGSAATFARERATGAARMSRSMCAPGFSPRYFSAAAPPALFAARMVRVALGASIPTTPSMTRASVCWWCPVSSFNRRITNPHHDSASASGSGLGLGLGERSRRFLSPSFANMSMTMIRHSGCTSWTRRATSIQSRCEPWSMPCMQIIVVAASSGPKR